MDRKVNLGSLCECSTENVGSFLLHVTYRQQVYFRGFVSIAIARTELDTVYSYSTDEKKKSNPLITACNVSRAILIPKLRYFNFIHIPYHELRQINAFTQLHCIGNYFYLHLGKSHNGVCVTQHNNVWPPRFCSTNKFHGNQMTMAISMVNCRDVYCFYIFLYMH